MPTGMRRLTATVARAVCWIRTNDLRFLNLARCASALCQSELTLHWWRTKGIEPLTQTIELARCLGQLGHPAVPTHQDPPRAGGRNRTCEGVLMRHAGSPTTSPTSLAVAGLFHPHPSDLNAQVSQVHPGRLGQPHLEKQIDRRVSRFTARD